MLAHPLGMVFRQVIVHGHDVHALARERVEVRGQAGGDGFALAGAHLGDAALVQNDAADHLHGEGALANGAHRAFAHHGVGLRQQIVQRFAARYAFAEQLGLPAQLLVRHLLIFRLQRVDGVDRFAQLLDLLIVRPAEQFFEKFQTSVLHQSLSRPIIAHSRARRKHGKVPFALRRARADLMAPYSAWNPRPARSHSSPAPCLR